MASAKEIQDRMRSIKDTLKITNAMYMISSSKLKKSKKMLADTEPYFYTLQSEMSRILRHLPDMNSIYFKTNAEIPERKRKAGYIVITADKGLAGSYNHNILKLAEEELEKRDDYKLFVLGELGRHYFEQKGINIDKQFHFVVQDPSLSRARRIAEDLLKLYHENQLDELVEDEILRLRDIILAEGERYNKIIKDWSKKKPLYERQIQQLNDKILSLRQQIEDLIIERIGDREHAQVYNNMITKREEEISAIEKRITDLREYDKICKQRKEQLKNTTQILDEILSEGTISDINLRMLVKRIFIHQNEDKSLDIRFEMNGEFNGTVSVFIEPTEELESA